MNTVNGLPGAGHGVVGLERAMRNFDGAAARVTKASHQFSAQDPDSLELSGRASSTDDSGTSIVSATVDLRMAKYTAIANMRVIQAADEVAGELLDISRR